MSPLPAPPRAWPRCRLPLPRLLLAGLLLASAAAWAGRHADHEQARAALQAGEVLPLPALLEKLQRSHPGRVLEIELERDDGRWIYELKLLEPGGRIVKLELDARSGELLRQRRRPGPADAAASQAPREGR
ncbi:PepSY domain-containing protein [Aquabacterium sp.]|uniref:PepSY domain-containing protein n=1 Tax=Aquabacterium sp. TaxID=1872578 RepID=UPI0037832E1B